MLRTKVLVISLLIIPIFIITLGFYAYNSFLNTKIQSDLGLKVVSGASKSQVLKIISDRNKLTYLQNLYSKIYLYLNKNIQFDAGEYNFSKDITYKDLFNNIRGGTKQSSVTFLEGWRVEENANALLTTKDYVYAGEYYSLAKDKIGYLFPDTYFVDTNTTAQKLIDLQLAEFEEKTTPLFTNYSGGLSKDELVIFASIVEREVRKQEDRNIVAGILIKRYEEGMPLDADATSQYGLFDSSYFYNCVIGNAEVCTRIIETVEYWPKVKDLNDLALSGEYNTRGKLGLPPTPICNPSLSSIQAVINPTLSDFYFYLNDSVGTTHFARTLDEHIANINKYL